MKIDDARWARGEFRHLSPELYPDLTLCGDLTELNELMAEVNVALFKKILPFKTAQDVEGYDVLGMKLKLIPKGWYVEDAEGNQIGPSTSKLTPPAS